MTATAYMCLILKTDFWYNLLVASGITDFEATETPETATEEVKEKVVE